MKSLCCVALNSKLRSILLFDISINNLQQVAGILVSLLKVTTECEKVVPLKLGTFESEDNLWGQVGLGDELEKQAFNWQFGLFSSADNTNEIKLVIIPDLTKLSLAAMRACVVLMGADVAHLERHGQHKYWQPNFCWLVGCSSQNEEIGKISPHLLDRFALRLNIQQIENNDKRVTQIQKLLNSPEKPQKLLFEERKIEPELQEWLRQIRSSLPSMTPSALETILNYNYESNIYHRREIALARFASTYAQLEAADSVTVKHVDKVAKIMGLKLERNNINNSIDFKSFNPQPETEDNDFEPRRSPELSEIKDESLSNNPPEIPVYQSQVSNYFPDTDLPEITLLENPYIEDTTSLEREIDSLKLPTRISQSKTIHCGTILGLEKTTNANDLAIVRSLLEAAKFQKIRQKKQGNNYHKLKILPSDLYRYRRASVAEQMFMLLLDYTCLEYCQWEEKLLPYLSWAYSQRASVGLIQVGIAPNSIVLDNNQSNVTINPVELRAKKISGQNILVPTIAMGLDLEKTKKGKATPLAHGFDLALKTLRHALQHGKNTVQKAVLVVVSDGRGNVPLEASHVGKIKPPVGKKGVEDALEVARKISNLGNLETIFLNPQSKQYPDLPLLLAKALGAKILSIPPVENWEITSHN
ncbi:MAG: hypothetical protein J7F05_21830 [Trichodesmium erythraeum GBRTRLIN201]|nr:hypothetical protein [Trichodesmium erythraeum GBRTRLIN201]